MRKVVGLLLCWIAMHAAWETRGAQAAPETGFIPVTAASQSSFYSPRSGIYSANNSGITETATGTRTALHDTNGNNMWLTQQTTALGSEWVQYDLGSAQAIQEMWIWNYNQANYPYRGLKKVYIDYSTDATTWTPLLNGTGTTFTLASAAGTAPSAATNLIDGKPVYFNGASARYVRIRLAGNAGVGNYDAPGANSYAGLAEVRFYSTKQAQPIIVGGPYDFLATSLTGENTAQLTLGATGGSATLNSVSFRTATPPAAFSFVTTPTLGRVFADGEQSSFTIAFRPRVRIGAFASTLTLSMTADGAQTTRSFSLTGLGANFAPQFIPGVVATASSTGGGRLAMAMVNNAGITSESQVVGLKTSYHVINTNSVTAAAPANTWLSNSTKTNQWLEFDLGRTVSLGEMWVWNYNERWTDNKWYNPRGVKDCQLFYRVKTSDPWVSAGSVSLAQAPDATPYAATNQAGGEPVNFGGVSARYVRIEIISNFSATDNFVGLGEVRFYEFVPPPNAVRNWTAFE